MTVFNLDEIMNLLRRFLGSAFLFIGGGILPSIFICPDAAADTVILKNGKEVKGLVVEHHVDRIYLSTENGEICILLSGVQDIRYDEPEQSFLQIGRAYEAQGKLEEALAYYQKAEEVNPRFEEAKKALMGVQNRFWAMKTEGPKNEVEKKGLLYQAWERGGSVSGVNAKAEQDKQKLVNQNFGMTLEKKGDWVRLGGVTPRKPAAVVGLKRGDRLAAIDGRSLRYLSAEAVAKHFLFPRYTQFTLEFERDCFLYQTERRKSLKKLGMGLRLEYEGLKVYSVKPGSAAHAAGLRAGDLLTRVNGTPTRYMPLQKAAKLVKEYRQERMVMAIRRSVLLARR